MSSDVGLFSTLGMIIGAGLSIVGGFALTWMYAPMVGGEFWPYIRFGASVIVAYIGFNVGAFGGAIVGGIVGVVLE